MGKLYAIIYVYIIKHNKLNMNLFEGIETQFLSFVVKLSILY